MGRVGEQQGTDVRTETTQRDIQRPSSMDETEGRLIIKDDVVAKIAGMAAREVEGVSFGTGSFLESVTGTARGATGKDEQVDKGIKAEVGERQAAFDLSIIVDYGYHIPSLVSDIRRRITSKVREMCDLETTEINVEVADIRLPGDRRESRVE